MNKSKTVRTKLSKTLLRWVNVNTQIKYLIMLLISAFCLPTLPRGLLYLHTSWTWQIKMAVFYVTWTHFQEIQNKKNIFLFSRCKGRCHDPSSPLTCRATKTRDKKVKMVMRSVLTGKEPVDRVKELVLDEHEECGCECSPELASLCAGETRVTAQHPTKCLFLSPKTGLI